MCMAESLYGSPETITMLLISYTPIQNVFGVKKKKDTPPPINFLILQMF